MQRRKAIIHIGPPKTGSTTIQKFLWKNRDTLKSRGILIPSVKSDEIFDGSVLHYHLYSIACYDDLPQTSLKYDWHHFSTKNFAQFDVNLCKKHFDSFLSDQFPLTLLSFECLCELNQGNIVRLKEYLDTHFQEYTIIAYLRRQPELFVSWYSQVIQVGVLPFDSDIDEFVSSYFHDKNRAFDNYQNMLQRWSNVFGKESIKPRIFDRKEMVKNDLLTDFSSTLGIDMEGLVHVAPQQVGVNAEITEFLKLLHLHFLVTDNQSMLAKYDLCRKVFKLFSQSGNVGYHLSRSQAQAIIDEYRESNNTVAREYFGRESLFNDDVSAYPEETLPHNLNLEKAIGISAAIIEELCQENAKLRSECDSFQNPKSKTLQHRLQRLYRKIKKIPGRISRILKTS